MSQCRGLIYSLENETRRRQVNSQRENQRDREEMLKKFEAEGNVDASPSLLPRRALRGISMFYNWHRSVTGFLLTRLLLPDL